MSPVRFGTVFSGIGGGDLAAQNCGFESVFVCEKKRILFEFLALKGFMKGSGFLSIEEMLYGGFDIPAVDLIIAGDPCPIRSVARGGRPSRTPDLSGYLLAVVAKCRPRWLVRENVCASDVYDFLAGLELLGYEATLLEINSSFFTGQSRRRQYCVADLSERMLTGFLRRTLKRRKGFWVALRHTTTGCRRQRISFLSLAEACGISPSGSASGSKDFRLDGLTAYLGTLRVPRSEMP